MIARMEEIYEIGLSAKEFASKELLEIMAEVTQETGREISVFLSRGGRVLDVTLGDQHTVSLPYIRKRRGNASLSGVRCIHTHPGASSMLSGVDIHTLLSSRLDAMAAVNVKNGRPGSMCVGYIGEDLQTPAVYGPINVRKLPNEALMAEIEAATQRVHELIALSETQEEQERAVLLGLNTTSQSMQELAELAKTADVCVVGKETQSKPRDAATYIGKGKAKELALSLAALDCDAVIVNDDLSPRETRNLEELLAVKVIDRTTLILEIFARHARTKEGSMQVELAQLKYTLPRLSGQGEVLSRLGGGIGTRGPGEQKLELDKRRIRKRIHDLEEQIAELSKRRQEQRKTRKKNRMVEVALVGYTNAGKSTLLNALTDAGVLAENKLFATLDPVCRKLMLPGGREVLLTDTVGFIEKLPHELISAFASTLEQVKSADLLLNVLDASDALSHEKSRVVQEVLAQIGAGDIPMVEVYNKSDLLEHVPQSGTKAVFISAKYGGGLDMLMRVIEEKVKPDLVTCRLHIPYSEGALLAKISEIGEQVKMDYTEKYVTVCAQLPRDFAARLDQKQFA